jgi:hypothetical protein
LFKEYVVISPGICIYTVTLAVEDSLIIGKPEELASYAVTLLSTDLTSVEYGFFKLLTVKATLPFVYPVVTLHTMEFEVALLVDRRSVPPASLHAAPV